jgi:hypothetical protein
VVIIVPGLYTFVSWYFVVQAVVIDEDRGLAAISRSAALVRGKWWRSLGVGICFVLPSVIASGVIGAAFTPLASAANSDAVIAVGQAVADTVTLPFLAIGATVYYMQLRVEAARTARP